MKRIGVKKGIEAKHGELWVDGNYVTDVGILRVKKYNPYKIKRCGISRTHYFIKKIMSVLKIHRK